MAACYVVRRRKALARVEALASAFGAHTLPSNTTAMGSWVCRVVVLGGVAWFRFSRALPIMRWCDA